MMKKLICAIAILLVLSPAAQGRKKEYVVGFYNLENLFDTVHDIVGGEDKNDYAYTPEGENAWTPEDYARKVHNMASVIKAMADVNGQFHAILGVAEVENRHVLEDLVAADEIRDAGFSIVHYESPDRRGIDVALLYRPDVFNVLESKPIPFDFNSSIPFEYNEEEKAEFRTRDILEVRGTLGGEMFAVFVAHLPSRLGSKGGDLRSRGAEIIHGESMRLMRDYPGIKIVVMGDMNDDPTDESMTTWLHGRETIAEVGPEDFFSPFISMIKNGYGTLEYRGAWNIFDIIAVNHNLVSPKKKTLRIKKIEADTYYGKVFNPPFIVQQDGQFAGTPFRTFSYGKFIGGYSDHYPTYIILTNAKK